MKNAFKLINLWRLYEMFSFLYYTQSCAYALSLLKNSYICDYLSFASNRKKIFYVTYKKVSLTAVTAIVKNYFFNFSKNWNMKSYCECAQSMPFYWFFFLSFFLHTFLYDDEREILNSHLCLIFWFLYSIEIELLYFHATVIFFFYVH